MLGKAVFGCFWLIYGRGHSNKTAKAGAARLVRAVPALASLLLPFPPLAGGDITLTEKTTAAAALRTTGWCFIQPVATGLNVVEHDKAATGQILAQIYQNLRAARAKTYIKILMPF